MATDYDAPRKNDDDTESIDAIKERIPDSLSSAADVDEADHSESFALPDVVASEDLDVVVLPAQDDEFTCTQCFIVKHHSLMAKSTKNEKICIECI